MYFRAASLLLFNVALAQELIPSTLLLIVSFALAAFLSSKEKKNGYYLTVAACILQIIQYSILLEAPFGFISVYLANPIAGVFDVAMLALAFHTQTRAFVKSRFK
jgi:hypothetical protein